MDFGVFDTPRPDVDAATAEMIAADQYGITGRADALEGERDRSFRIRTSSRDFVLKVGNAADRRDALEGQGSAVRWALSNDPSLPIAEVVPTKSGRLAGRYRAHALQLTEFIDGDRPNARDIPPGLSRSLGRAAARLDRALRGFDHAALHRSFPWTLGELAGLAQLVEHVPADRRTLVSEVLRRLLDETLPKLGRLPRQAIHGDLNLDNLVVDPEDPERILGIFDFGDMSWSPRITDVAIAATYQAFGGDPVGAMAQVASAYHVEDQLDPAEIELIPILVSARCVQSLLMSTRSVATGSENIEYDTSDADQTWDTLVAVRNANDAQAVAEIALACGLTVTGPGPSVDDALALRRQRMAPSLHLSYDRPVHPYRGEGMWLVDRDGTRLLDAYNNVPHVGHAHPRVVAALTRQARELTTNTRYLVDGVAEYADRLVALMPEPLSTVLFVNSGSEANDLAYRIAAAVTARRGAITTANAYHGATAVTTALSPEELADSSREPWVAHVGGEELLKDGDAPGRLARELDDTAARLERHSHEPAMLIMDTVFSSDGIFDVPEGFLDAARSWADTAGALYVADEVQAGFGRVGRRFWGFSASAAVPDIVTLGKPMGNGYPLAAVVTSQAIAEEFAARSHFFSTFAGSPVAAAVGTAVLDVIESENLADNATRVGSYLRRQVRELDDPRIVAVRGPGLFVGIELPNSAVAARTVNDLRLRGVLIGSTGRGGNVLKIRPPLVATRRHADIVASALRRSLRSGDAVDRGSSP